MTAVTEAEKRVSEDDAEDRLRQGDLRSICADPELARHFAGKLLEIASRVAPGRTWSPEDLREVLDAAAQGPGSGAARLLEGRYFRKRLREQLDLADRYGDSFAVVVINLRDVQAGEYTSVLDAVTDRLRQSDMVFPYRSRFALILPRMRMPALEPLIERVRELVAVGVGEQAIGQIAAIVYPDVRFPESSDALDWAEDQLR